jgi:hypothetical protein
MYPVVLVRHLVLGVKLRDPTKTYPFDIGPFETVA